MIKDNTLTTTSTDWTYTSLQNNCSSLTSYDYSVIKQDTLNKIKNFLITDKERLIFNYGNVKRNYVNIEQLLEFLDNL